VDPAAEMADEESVMTKQDAPGDPAAEPATPPTGEKEDRDRTDPADAARVEPGEDADGQRPTPQDARTGS
jgi:hypothetical protein